MKCLSLRSNQLKHLTVRKLPRRIVPETAAMGGAHALYATRTGLQIVPGFSLSVQGSVMDGDVLGVSKWALTYIAYVLL